MNQKVLIIDDEDFLRSFYAHFFVNKGFTVLEADNGLDGVKIAEEEKPPLIILDLIMPGMHGFAVCKQLRENPAFDDTTIIITSAKSYKPDIDKALELGADAYVIKPVEFDDLYKIVQDKMKLRARKES
ncbi:MAG TPA: response regulator [Bacteroidota bacterium]|nr:response regulator [Bacteroidota bacterium]